MFCRNVAPTNCLVFLALLACVLLPFNVLAQQLQWFNAFTSTDRVEVTGIATDAAGFCYVVGHADDTMYVVPGSSGSTPAATPRSAFVAKLDQLWPGLVAIP